MSFRYLQFSQQNEQKNSTYFYGTSSWIVFICFLGELKTPKRRFEINWPLKIVSLNIANNNKYCILTLSFSYLKQFKEIIENCATQRRL